MRIVHFSDLHIGVENYGRPVTEKDLELLPPFFAPGEDRQRFLGYSTRLLDFLCAFDELIDFSLRERVDLVLFSGDAYKSREPTQTHQREFARRVIRLSTAGVPVFLLVGNHDLPHAAYKASAVEIFGTLGVPLVTVGDRLGVYLVDTRAGPLQVLALPWIRRSVFLNRDDTRNLPYDQINDQIEEKLTALLRSAAASLDPAIPSAVSAHVTLNTAKLGSERTMMMGHDHMLLQSVLTALPADYVALGHIHRAQRLAEQPIMTYGGSLQRVDFGEEDDDAKGFWVVDFDTVRPLGARTKAEFHPVTARPFVTVDVTLEDIDLDPTTTVIRAIQRRHIAGAIVRVNIRLKASLNPFVRDREIREALETLGAHTVAGISRLVQREERGRLGGIEVGTKSPSEMLRLYLGEKKVAPERADKLATFAQRLMAAQTEHPEDGAAG